MVSTWFGKLGALHDITCPAKQSRTGGIAHSTWELTTGRRAAQVTAARRVWALDTTGATPQALSALEAHYYGAFGPGPFYFVPPDAVATNLVTPWDSLMESTAPLAVVITAHSAWFTGTGGQIMPDGTVVSGGLVRIAEPASPQRIRLTAYPIPCPPGGGKVTISGWVAADPDGPSAHLLAGWTDSTGTVVAYDGSTDAVTSPVMQRVSVTVDSGTHPGLHVYGESYATQMAGIAVTWTDELYPYAVGRGCSSAVLESASLDTVLAVAGSKNWGRYDTSSYQVTEVG